MTTETMQQWMDWSNTAFPNATKFSSYSKLEDEMKELYEAMQQENEYAAREEIIDCIMCLLHIAKKLGLTANEVSFVFTLKFYRNKTRDWIENDNHTYSHKK